MPTSRHYNSRATSQSGWLHRDPAAIVKFTPVDVPLNILLNKCAALARLIDVPGKDAQQDLERAIKSQRTPAVL